MAIVVEDGSGIDGSNSYASVTDLTAYATARGLTIPADEAAQEVLLIQAMDAIESLEDSFIGERTFIDADALAWPRTDPSNIVDGSLTLSNGQIVADDAIPKQLVLAQCQLAVDLQSASFFSVTTGQVVIEDTVGPLTTKYAAPSQGGGDGMTPTFQKFEALISILQQGSGALLKTIRV